MLVAWRAPLDHRTKYSLLQGPVRRATLWFFSRINDKPKWRNWRRSHHIAKTAACLSSAVRLSYQCAFVQPSLNFAETLQNVTWTLHARLAFARPVYVQVLRVRDMVHQFRYSITKKRRIAPTSCGCIANPRRTCTECVIDSPYLLGLLISSRMGGSYTGLYHSLGAWTREEEVIGR